MAREQHQSCNIRSSRRSFIVGGVTLITTGALLGVVALSRAQKFSGEESLTSLSGEIIVYKTPTCGCCTGWVNHLTGAGLNTRIVNQTDLTRTREKLKAPNDLMSCHIAVVDGYVVEGHVPASAIKKLLSERPIAIGLFVPGMPLGSPGMESPYGSQPYDVILLKRDGTREIFASYIA